MNVVAIGEILWDLLPDGPRLGGAPANFLMRLKELRPDANLTLISRVGDDRWGQKALKELRSRGLATDAVGIDPVHSTGTVEVELDEKGVPNYDILADVAWDHLQLNAAALDAVRLADWICFGTLAQRTDANLSTIGVLLENANPKALRLLDLNLREGHYALDNLEGSLENCDLLKCNEEELDILGGVFRYQSSPLEQLNALADEFRLRLVALTRGPRGSLLFSKGESDDHPGIPVQARNTVGAGDAFTAAIVAGYATKPLKELNESANRFASVACG